MSKLPCRSAQRRQIRQGLTLLELIVVLVVLVALAGILIPMLPNVVGRASVSVGATNASEVDRWVQLYQQNYQAYPDVLDNLVGTTGPIDYLPGNLTGQITLHNLTAAEVLALNNAGITTVATLQSTKADFTATNGGSPTFNPYQYTTGTTVVTQLVASGLMVAGLTEAAVETPPGIVRDSPNTNVGDVYVVFGFGKQSTAIGRIVPDAPVHFSQFSADTAGSVYCRYGLVFRLARGTGTTASPASTPLTTAQFMGTISFEPTGIMGSDGQLANYYDNIMKQQ
jgi:prepilin-type N-terminal cleavage/methylation domain-containing protein